MKEKIRQFMIGRYGTDGLNQFLNIASLVLILVYILTRLPLLLYVGVVLLGFQRACFTYVSVTPAMPACDATTSPPAPAMCLSTSTACASSSRSNSAEEYRHAL